MPTPKPKTYDPPLHPVKAETAMRDLGQWPIQKFHVSHLATSEFKGEGLRPYVVYRDLGAKEATGGLVDAHVNQMVYVLKGWNRVEFEGQGEHMMVAGSCWIQPAGIKHTVLEYSDDLEVLEIIIPGTFDTVNVDEPPGFD